MSARARTAPFRSRSRRCCCEIGRWLEVNGEGIYGTRPWHESGEGPTQVLEGAFTDTKRTVFTSEDIRFTTKDGALYAHVMQLAGGWSGAHSFAGNQFHLFSRRH